MNKETLELAYELLKKFKSADIKSAYKNKTGIKFEDFINNTEFTIPFQYCKTKVAAQKYLIGLINESMKNNITTEQQILNALAALDVKIETIKQLIDAQITIAKNILND